MGSAISLEWPGKVAALAMADQPAGVVLPEGVQIGANSLLAADNLLAMKAMTATFSETFQLVLTDPPYNTGARFTYDDRRGQEEWLSLMLPRLVLMRQLLRPQGFAMLFIDGKALPLLHLLCREVFGAENEVGLMVWEKKRKPSFLDGHMGSVTDYIVVFAKDRTKAPALTKGHGEVGKRYPLNNKGNPSEVLRFPAGSVDFELEDQDVKAGDMSSPGVPCWLKQGFSIHNGTNAQAFEIEGQWRFNQTKVDALIKQGERFHASRLPLRLNLIKSSPEKKKVANLLSFRTNDLPTNEQGRKEVASLFGQEGIFDYPKPLDLLRWLIEAATEPGDGVLDPFAGSGSTGVAAASLGRWFSLCQLPEPLADEHPLNKNGETLSDLTAERLRREGVTNFVEAKLGS